ncbi:MAG TPA: methyltransferase domain-containing protein [Usitatibacter sp.]
MKITPQYRELNRTLHFGAFYGISGAHWAKSVASICKTIGSRDVLDYGCGQRTLEKALGFPIRNYDPCIDGLEATPAPADLVVCTDVLEHIEPECLDEVLDDLRRVTRRFGFLVIASRPALKNLPDGRNAHLIQEGEEWWLPKIAARWQIQKIDRTDGEFLLVVAAV